MPLRAPSQEPVVFFAPTGTVPSTGSFFSSPEGTDPRTGWYLFPQTGTVPRTGCVLSLTGHRPKNRTGHCFKKHTGTIPRTGPFLVSRLKCWSKIFYAQPHKGQDRPGNLRGILRLPAPRPSLSWLLVPECDLSTKSQIKSIIWKRRQKVARESIFHALCMRLYSIYAWHIISYIHGIIYNSEWWHTWNPIRLHACLYFFQVFIVGKILLNWKNRCDFFVSWPKREMLELPFHGWSTKEGYSPVCLKMESKAPMFLRCSPPYVPSLGFEEGIQWKLNGCIGYACVWHIFVFPICMKIHLT